MDKDANGEDYERNATISQEHMERSKTLTHEYQVQLRNERKAQEQAKLLLRKSQENDRIRRLLQKSKACEDKLLQTNMQ